MRKRIEMFLLLAVTTWTASALAEQKIGEIPAQDFDLLYAAILPQPGESPWREIPWLTNITEARRRAVAEDKPLVIFTAADGSPLSRT